MSRHRHASPRPNRTLFISSRPSRSTISIAAGTALAAAAAATALTIGPTSITRPPPRIATGRFGLAGDLARGTGQGAGPNGTDPNGTDPNGAGPGRAGHGTGASKAGYSTEVAVTLREQHAYQARAQAASNAAAVQRARLAAHKALVLAEQERAPASQQPTAQPTTQPATAQPTTPATAPSGSPQQLAMSMLAGFGWSSSEFSCLDPLWERESGWNPYADNPTSGAYGIPQALPGSKMASAGADWQSDAATQIRWGLGYIKATYGSPCGAWDHEESYGWY